MVRLLNKSIVYSTVFPVFLVLSLVLVSTLVSANCVFLEVGQFADASVSKGVQASFALSVRNTGSSSQLVSLSGSCPSDLNCALDPSSATLTTGESRSFVLTAGTAQATQAYYEIPVEITAGSPGSTHSCDERVARLNVALPSPTPTAEPGAGGFEATLSPSGAVSSGRPGETIEYAITVSNGNDAKGFVKIRVEGEFAATTLFSTTNFDLLSGTEKIVSAKVRLPPGTPGGTYALVFRVQATDGSTSETTEFSLPASVFVFSDVVDVDLLNQPVDCLMVEHDERLSWPMELRNNGETKGPFVLSLDAPAGVKKFVRVSPALLEVDGGDQQPVDLIVTPSSSVTVAAYQFNLLVKYLDYGVLSVPLCVNVTGVTGFDVETQDEYAVKRGVVTPLRITITNTGSVADDFSVQPALVSWLSQQAQAIPSSFTLSPGESKAVSVVVASSLEKTPLGTKYLPVVIRSSRTLSSELYDLKIKISSAPQPGLSYLQIKKTRFTAPVGESFEDSVEVVNSKSEALHGVTLTIFGVPSAWYSVSPASQDVASKVFAEFNVVWNIPKSKAGRYDVTLYAESQEGEFASVNATLEAIALEKDLSARALDPDYSHFESSGEILVTVVLSNTGGVALSGITPVAPNGFAFSTAPLPVALSPGESKSVTLSLKPRGSVADGEQVSLSFQSNEGAVSPPITVFAAPPQKAQQGNGSWVLLAVAALLIIVVVAAYYFRKEGGKRDEDSAQAQLEDRSAQANKFKQKKLV